MPRPKMIDPQKPVSIAPVAGPPKARKGNTELPSITGLGSMAYSDRELTPLFVQPIVKRQEKGRDTWANTALVLAMRAKKASQTYGKKDFNALYRLVLSASIAFDKAFPQVQAPSGNNLVIQLFGSLGAETARRILEPARPMLEPPTASIQVLPLDSGPAAEPCGAVRVSGDIIVDQASNPLGNNLDDQDIPTDKVLDGDK